MYGRLKAVRTEAATTHKSRHNRSYRTTNIPAQPHFSTRVHGRKFPSNYILLLFVDFTFFASWSWAGLNDALPASVGHFWITHKTLWRNKRQTIPIKEFLREKPSNIWFTLVDFLFCQKHGVMLSNSVCFTTSCCHLKDEGRHTVGRFQAQLCVHRSWGNVRET